MPDGKYINVKGYDDKIAFLWGVDYFKHDFPFILLAPTENYLSWSKYFSFFQTINHSPQVIVCDDNISLKMAAQRYFPRVKIQTCYNHLKENIRRKLRVRSDDNYKEMFEILQSALDSSKRLPRNVVNKRLFYVYRKWKHDDVALSVLIDLIKKKEELFVYKWVKKASQTTNLIEAFNSHLEGRLKRIRSFNSFEYAKLWLNGYVLKRKYTRFTDCTKKFKHLNGHCPIEMAMFDEKLPPVFFKL